MTMVDDDDPDEDLFNKENVFSPTGNFQDFVYNLQYNKVFVIFLCFLDLK